MCNVHQVDLQVAISWDVTSTGATMYVLARRDGSDQWEWMNDHRSTRSQSVSVASQLLVEALIEVAKGTAIEPLESLRIIPA
jgi:hypothetical protein